MTKKHVLIESWNDPIVAEVRQVREALFAKADYDIQEFCRRLSAKQATSGHTVVRRGSPSAENSLEEVIYPSSEIKAG
ncbi:MAG TPA: hypothetical protein VKK31_06265 [Thermoanaerobaculia bacterium]|nr:hypothetical protein [Thermoanaerobaculia bacterium]